MGTGAKSDISALLQAAQDDKAKILAHLKTYLSDNLQIIRHAFLHGQCGALETANRISCAHDDIVVALFEHAALLFELPEKCLSLCAIGGYGRAEMAPFSDLDIVFLRGGISDQGKMNAVTEFVLYMLWDLGLKVGHAVRSPAQCVELGREDETVLSALLDLRLLAGAAQPATALVGLLAKERTRAKKRRFIAAKLAARDRRHEAVGNSRYVIEPNVKEGKGGLRDLHELYWIARFLYGGKNTDAPISPHTVNAYLKLGLLNKKAAGRFESAAEFLWKVRIHLHYLSNRAVEVLGFDKQAEMARLMGYDAPSPEVAVGHFMHHYFNITREVGALTRMACAKLETESQLLLPQGLDRLLPTSRRGLKAPGFVLDHGRLNFSAPQSVKTRPVLMLELFQIAGRRNLDIHPGAFQAILSNIDRIDEDFRQAQQAFDIFTKILLDSQAPGLILRTMNEAGLLGAYIPEFGAIVGRTQFNMHHAYTVDEHTIRLVHYLDDLECGRLEREHPLSSGFINDWDTRTRLLVYLACLLHDVGKAEDDQCADGARLAAQACLRMGLVDADIETIAWLVRHHLLMSETAQRRDISDPATIREFADKIGSLKRLQMLTVLTVVDIRAVGPGIWNDWKGELLRQLYYSVRSELMGLAPQNMTAFGAVSNLQALGATANKKTHAVKTKLNRPHDITELWVLSRDRPHLFADLAGAIAEAGATVIGAKLHTAEDGRVFNRFYLQNTQGLAFGRKNEMRLKALEDTTLLAAQGALENFRFSPDLVSSRAKAIPTPVRVSIERQEDGMMIEVSGRDRRGLLFDLAEVLARHHLSVRSAHIEVLGPKAVDVFYVSPGAAAFSQKALREDLRAVLAVAEESVA